MTPDVLTRIAIFVAIALAIALVVTPLVAARAEFWGAEVKKVREGGYVPPAPYFLTELLMRSFCVLLGFFEVGPIRILGRHRLPKGGPMIIAPFHADAGDGSIISALLGVRPMYYLIRTTEVLGWRGWIGTMTGAIAVDEESQEGRTRAFKATVSALQGGGKKACVVIFPQGHLVPDEEIRRADFKSGTILIAKLAARKRKEAIWIVPVGLHYRTEAHEATLFHKLINALGFKNFRNLFGQQNYGAYAIVGKPFKVTPRAADLDEVQKGLVLADDADKATDTYVQRMQILQKAAKFKSKQRHIKHDKMS